MSCSDIPLSRSFTRCLAALLAWWQSEATLLNVVIRAPGRRAIVARVTYFGSSALANIQIFIFQQRYEKCVLGPRLGHIKTVNNKLGRSVEDQGQCLTSADASKQLNGKGTMCVGMQQLINTACMKQCGQQGTERRSREGAIKHNRIHTSARAEHSPFH